MKFLIKDLFLYTLYAKGHVEDNRFTLTDSFSGVRGMLGNPDTRGNVEKCHRHYTWRCDIQQDGARLYGSVSCEYLRDI